MARKVMRTISDVRDEIRGEALSTQPLLSNDYTYGNIHQVEESIDNILPEEPILEDKTEIEDLSTKKEDKPLNKGKGSCGCRG